MNDHEERRRENTSLSLEQQGNNLGESGCIKVYGRMEGPSGENSEEYVHPMEDRRPNWGQLACRDPGGHEVHD